MQTKFDWSDLPVLLAFGRTGTMIDAARELGIDETTAARRLKRLETALGTPLITRQGNKVRMTAAGRLALDKVRTMELAAEALANDHEQTSSTVSGSVRITGLSYVINQILLPAMPAHLAAHPKLLIQIQTENRNLDLLQHEADIALRMAAPTSPLLAAEKIGELGFAAYRPRNRFQGVPIKRCLWIGPDEQYATIAEAVWLRANIPTSRIVLQSSSALSNAAAVKSGLACAVLPVTIGDHDKDMVRIAADVLLRREIWLLQRHGTPAEGAIGVTANWIARVFKTISSQLRG